MSNKRDFNKLMSKIRRNPYEIPPSLIKQLQEHTGGFLLCALDNLGNTKFYENFDNAAIRDAVELKLLQILAAKAEKMNQQIIDAISDDDTIDPSDDSSNE